MDCIQSAEIVTSLLCISKTKPILPYNDLDVKAVPDLNQNELPWTIIPKPISKGKGGLDGWRIETRNVIGELIRSVARQWTYTTLAYHRETPNSSFGLLSPVIALRSIDPQFPSSDTVSINNAIL